MKNAKPRVVFGNKFEVVMTSFSKRLCGLVLALLPSVSGADERATIDLIYELGETRFQLAEYILRASSDYVATNSDVSSRQGHLALKSVLNGSKQFRSILAISGDGELMYDSYNPLPFLGGADLSQRRYFERTTNNAPKELVINRAVVGKQSGELFMPLAMAVPNGLGRGQKVVMLTAPPAAFMPNIHLCSFCGVSMLAGDEVIASNRPMSDVNEAVASRLEFDGPYGATEIRVRGMPVRVHWRRSDATGVVYLFYQARPISPD
ncbi:hypothetical protein [Falsiruegeria mediterranea]|uniref:Uncharacterized protein n=1 Tax=Falsiruegeria mediterranea M17 TaxID=1200281 RepID=A0A2R8C5D7_9RHOB|nr:hypothetical protein [Falsiruegeria mediterranea]SPJ27651.1 hypothetical protein TRM7615_01141 [Falsiruegeria mediterranea M17]